MYCRSLHSAALMQLSKQHLILRPGKRVKHSACIALPLAVAVAVAE
jgi:hypothetical protein